MVRWAFDREDCIFPLMNEYLNRRKSFTSMAIEAVSEV